MTAIFTWLSSSAAAAFAKVAGYLGTYFAGWRAGRTATQAGDAKAKEASDADVLAREQAMAEAQLNAPHDVSKRLEDGTF